MDNHIPNRTLRSRSTHGSLPSPNPLQPIHGQQMGLLDITNAHDDDHRVLTNNRHIPSPIHIGDKT